MVYPKPLQGPCAQISALWHLPENGRISQLPCHCFVLTLWVGGVVWGSANDREVLLGGDF